MSCKISRSYSTNNDKRKTKRRFNSYFIYDFSLIPSAYTTAICLVFECM